MTTSAAAATADHTTANIVCVEGATASVCTPAVTTPAAPARADYTTNNIVCVEQLLLPYSQA